MTNKELTIMQGIIQATVQEKVNGKIDILNTKLQAHIEKHDEDWKTIEPMLKNYTSWSTTKKVLWGLLAPALAILSAWGGITEIWKMFSNK